MYKTSMPKESTTCALFPDDVEYITISRKDYDRNVEQMLLDKIKAETKLRHIEQYFDDLDDIDYKTIKYEVEKILNE